MNLNLCIVSATPALIREALHEAATHAYEDLNFHYFMNAYPGDIGEFQDGLGLRQYPKIKGVLGGRDDENQGCTKGMHIIWDRAKFALSPGPDDLFVYIHDDLTILEEGWDVRVKKLFRDRPQAMLAGFGGARQLGIPELYKVPYADRHDQLLRVNFASNLTNAEAHGRRVDGEERSATLDSFALIVRASFLEELGGWDWWPFPCHNFDNAVCCEAKKRNYEVWLIPVHCRHQGGTTSCSPVYQELAKKWGGDLKLYMDSHALLYERYRGVLPIFV